MGKYIKLFNNHAEYSAFLQTEDFIKPNVSHCIQQNDVHYNPLSMLKIHYLVSDDTQDTKIIYYYDGDWYTPSLAVNEFDKIYIDGVLVEPSEVDEAQGLWSLSTGEHVITYVLKDSTWLKQPIFNTIPIITSVEMDSSIVRTNASAFTYSGDLLEADENGLKYADRHLVAVTDKTKSSYTLKNNTITIGSRTFGEWRGSAYNSCTNITSVGVIGSGASVEIPNTVKEIGEWAFGGCTSLTSVTIPGNVKKIGWYCFKGSTSIETIILNEGVEEVEGQAFGYIGNSLRTLTLPNSIKTIGDSAFMADYSSGTPTKKNLVTSLTLPNSLESIGSFAFYYYNSLTSLSITDSVKTIDRCGFSHMDDLQTLTIGSGIESIGDSNFEHSNSLTSITITAVTPPTLGTNCFTNTNDCPIYVPSASVDAYKAATNWSAFASRIQAIPTE